jgi:hypothetical protein
MSSIAKNFLGAALIYLLLGLLAQAVNVFDVWLGFNPLTFTALAATRELLLLGWLTQLGLALVYDRWLLPGSNATSSQLVFVLFNLGLPLVITGQPGVVLFGGWWAGAAAALGGVLQFLAGVIFVREAWRALRKN